jgi:23S rRNA-/tRNA-specific pseudouridylate synthase
LRRCFAEDIPLEFFTRNEDLLSINKPQVMVGPPSAGHESGTLSTPLLYQHQDLSGNGVSCGPS